MTVTVEAGARVCQVVEALRPHGLTLQNYASIAEQQMGGYIQVGAHGTGATIPSVDEQVLAFTLITPGYDAPPPPPTS
jgi:L-galactono-1,4-lactone dehydrogenase